MTFLKVLLLTLRYYFFFILSILGYGIFTKRFFKENEYLLTYNGELITSTEGEKREKMYDRDERGNFMFFFQYSTEKKSRKLW